MHLQPVVQVMQAVTKNYSVATAVDCHITIGWNAVVKATENFYLICNHISVRLQGRERY